MNHTIKGIIIVVAITSMLVLGTASMVPIMQNASARSTNINTNTNSADSSSSSDATASNTNNITNTATASNSQEQDACAVAVTCQEGSTTVTPPPADPCPHSPYTDFVAGTGCQDGAPTTTCTPSTLADRPATPTDGTCTATLPNADAGLDLFFFQCRIIPGSTFTDNPDGTHTCTFPSTPTCPPPEGSTQTPTVVNGRCTIQPGPA